MLGFAIFLPGIGSAQQLQTMNQYVGVVESNGILTIYKGNPANNNSLTFDGESFLTVYVNGVYYSDNPNLVSTPAQPVTSLYYSTPTSTLIRDTIESVWKESGFDIVEDAYPVAFSSSGVIIISAKIVNHSTSDLPAQAQYLLDNDNSTTTGGATNGNDFPYTFTRYGYIPNTSCWQTYPPNPIPSFDLTFEYPPSSALLGTVGVGYFDDTYTPSPLGLLPLNLVQFGYWPEMVYTTWGPTATSANYKDNGTLIMGQPTSATSINDGDTVTEIFRTAYGVPDWCYDHGQIVGVAMYPKHITWSSGTMSYSPNPFRVQAFLFTDDAGSANGVTIRQTVSDPINITNPKPVGLPTTQVQNVGSIPFTGVAIVNWTDSVLLLPSGCKAGVPIPVDIDFDVKATGIANGVDSPIFISSWGCGIDVDCAHPDTTPPSFHNSFAGCDSIFDDTVTAHDNGQFDLGLKNITYTSTDLTAAQYQVTIVPPPPYNCIDTSAKIFVQQVDTVHGGHVIFTFTDCADNVSKDTVCFTAHPPLPDLTAPLFWLDTGAADCHDQCTEWNVTDSNKSATSIDRGVDSIIVVSKTNATVSGIPAGGNYPVGTPEATFRICVTDSLLDDTVIVRASDSSHNFRFDTITYCTTPDTHPPIITIAQYNATDSSFHVHVTDTQAWDRGVDSVWVEDTSNVITIPASAPYSVPCKPVFDFRIIVLDTSECAGASVYAKDCWGNTSTPLKVSLTKGAVPLITVSKTVLCSTADSSVLDAGPGYTGYEWSDGKSTRRDTTGAGSFTVTVQEGTGCPVTSAPVTVTLSPATPQITPPGPIALCAPDDTLLDAGAGYVAYQWLRDGVAMTDTTTEKVLVSSSGNYSVQVTNNAGCQGTSTPVSVTIYPIPAQPVITAANDVMTSTPATSYQWSLNGTPIPGATKQTDTATSGGAYTVTITDSHGCSNTSEPFSNEGSTLIGLPAIIYAQQSNQIMIPLSVLSSQSVPLSNQGFTVKIAFNRTLLVPNGSPQGGTLVSPTTVKGDSLIVEYTGTGSAAQGTLLSLPFIAALGDDSCTVISIDSFAWSAPNIAVTTKSGNFCLSNLCYQGGPQLIDPNGTATLSKPVPNPSFNNIQISYKLIEQGPTSLIVYDLLGHEVLRLFDANASPGTYTVSADVSTLPSGSYVYSLRTPTIVLSDHLQIAR